MTESVPDTITSITRYEDNSNHWEGYSIITSNHTIDVGMENSRDCCEQWKVDIIFPDGYDAIGSTFVGVRWCRESELVTLRHQQVQPNRPIPQQEQREEGTEEESGWLSYEDSYDENWETKYAGVQISFKDAEEQTKHFVVLLSNDHNGYYPHYIRLVYDGVVDQQSL